MILMLLVADGPGDEDCFDRIVLYGLEDPRSEIDLLKETGCQRIRDVIADKDINYDRTLVTILQIVSKLYFCEIVTATVEDLEDDSCERRFYLKS